MNRIMIDIIRATLSGYQPKRADPDGRIQAAVALVLVPVDEGLEMLLIKRTERDDDPWSGQMAMPGGRRDAEDDDLRQTAIRETREETSVDLGSAELIGELDDLSPSSPHLPPILVRPFVFILPSRPTVVLDNDEVALHIWVPLHTLPVARALEEIVIKDFRITASGYRLGSHFVWGMTERIISPFLKMVRQE